MTTLIIARHGNTFDPGDTVLRVGARTDLPLSASGREQARWLGQYFLEKKIKLDLVYTSQLKRTQETAKIALDVLNTNPKIISDSIFDEIDYGEDDGQPEEKVLARIGYDAMQAWEKDAVAPEGWSINPEEVIRNWKFFADQIMKKYSGKTILVITSNGIARFAPYLTGDFSNFKSSHSLKLSTGALARFTYKDKRWKVEDWNFRPGLQSH